MLRASFSMNSRPTTSSRNSLRYLGMRSLSDTARARRRADSELSRKRRPQKRSATNRATAKATAEIGKKAEQMKKADQEWSSNPRWNGITRNYSISDVRRLQGSVLIEHTL